MRLKLYVVPGSHPSAAVEAALALKGLEYERVALLPVLHKAFQRVVFGTATVPGLRIDGERLTGSRAILRRLDALVPDPPLLPSDPEARADVERAEAWGDETLQAIARRVTWSALRRCPKAMRSFSEGFDLPIPVGVAMMSAGLVARAEVLINRAQDPNAQADLRSLPGHLDRVDRWIADGTIGGDPPNAADLQIASSVRLLLTLGDVAPLVEGRPCAELARRRFPAFAGSVPAGALPAAWVPA